MRVGRATFGGRARGVVAADACTVVCAWNSATAIAVSWSPVLYGQSGTGHLMSGMIVVVVVESLKINHKERLVILRLRIIMFDL